MRYRRTAHVTFRPSTYSKGISFPKGGMAPLGPGPGEKRRDYGSLLWAYLFSRMGSGSEEPEEGTPAAIVRDYWWVMLAATPVIFYGVNKAMDKLEK